MASSPQMNQFNERWRSSPQYRQILMRYGVNPDAPINASDSQRRAIQKEVERLFGMTFPKGTELDRSLNWNEDEGFSRHKKWIIPAAIGAGTLGLGAFGVGPAAGLFGGSGAGASAGAAGTAAAFDAVPSAAANAAGIASLAGSGLPGGVAGGTAAALGGVIPAATTGGGFAGNLLDRLLSPEGLATAGTIAASLATGGDGTNEATRASEAQAQRLQQITEARMRRVDPLHEAITQLAFSRLPVSSRQGLTLPRVALPE